MSADRKDGGPAFPVADIRMAEPGTLDEGRLFARGGLTVRDYFAAKVMAAALTGQAMRAEAFLYSDLAGLAFEVADAMLAERDK